MAKTKPIGVRFDKDLIEALKDDNIANSPQKVLNFLTEFYRESYKKDKLVSELNKSFFNSKLFKNKTEQKLNPKVVERREDEGMGEAEIKEKTGIKIKIVKNETSAHAELKKEISDWENKKCPGYMGKSNFEDMRKKVLLELKARL